MLDGDWQLILCVLKIYLLSRLASIQWMRDLTTYLSSG